MDLIFYGIKIRTQKCEKPLEEGKYKKRMFKSKFWKPLSTTIWCYSFLLVSKRS